MKTVVIIGGHGQVALHLAKQISTTHSVFSVIRDPAHEEDITATGAKPALLSLEDDPVGKFTAFFESSNADVVVFSAGAGGKGGAERTKKVDYEGALKIFDAIDAATGKKPRLILVSAIDIRDPDKIPTHYNEKDLASSKRIREAIPEYMHWKYEADKNLVARTGFKWTILRPGGLLNNAPATGQVNVGVTHMGTIPREDVAKTLAALVDREDAAGLALDLVSGEETIPDAIDKAIQQRATAWIG